MHNMVDKSVNLNWDEWKIIILNPNKKEKKEKKEKKRKRTSSGEDGPSNFLITETQRSSHAQRALQSFKFLIKLSVDIN